MDYYGLLFLYYLKGLSGKSVLRLFFNIEAGGTEQLLPENTSTPTTTPILADIQYPDGLRTDQYFTYRETPTTVSNKARIKTIKGNTLNWNQLVGRTDSYTTSKNGITVTITGASDKSISLTAQGTVNLTAEDQNYYSLIPTINIKNGHKYLLSSTSSTFYLYGYAAGTTAIDQQKSIFTSTRDALMGFTIRPNTSAFTEGKAINETFYVMFIDLTQMFGSGNEPTTVEEFTSLFPLPYYSYNQGSLLSFMGNGIKTVSKNQFNTQIVSPSTTVGTTLTKGDGSIRLQYTGTGRYTGFNFMNPNGGLVSDWANKLLLKKKYRLSFDFSGAEVTWTCGLRTASANSFVGSITMQNQGHYSLTLNLDTVTEDVYISWARTGNSTNPFDVTVSNIQLELGTTETPYTPYEEQTISLPISTYFPTGMKSAGSVYDELTESKAITRIGSVDLGSLTWEYRTTGSVYAPYFYAAFTGIKPNGNPNVRKANILCSKYSTAYRSQDVFIDKTICADGSSTELTQLQIKDSSYTDATAFKNSLQGQYLYYELATPTETPITTEDANEALSLLMGKSVSSNNAKQMIGIITKGE